MYTEKLKKEVRETFISNSGRPRSKTISYHKANQTALFEKIVKATNSLPEDAEFNERYYCVLNDIIHRPLCEMCGEPLDFASYKSGYRKFCSQQCQLEYAHSCVTTESYMKMAETNRGRKRDPSVGEKISKGKLKSGYKHSEETRRKISEETWSNGKTKTSDFKVAQMALGVKKAHAEKRYTLGELNGMYGRKLSDETKRKMRVTHSKLAQEQGVYPRYNQKACEFFSLFNELLCTNGRHALNGGEYFVEDLGYYVDYINHDLKLIVEWDEAHHYTADGKLKEKDTKRQEEIQKRFPDYDFLRIKEDDAPDGLEELVQAFLR